MAQYAKERDLSHRALRKYKSLLRPAFVACARARACEILFERDRNNFIPNSQPLSRKLTKEGRFKLHGKEKPREYPSEFLNGEFERHAKIRSSTEETASPR